MEGKKLNNKFTITNFMDRESVKQYLIEANRRKLPDMIERDLDIEISGKVKVIYGVRRAGKSYRMFQEMNRMIKGKETMDNILHLNLEHPLLSDLSHRDLYETLSIQWQLFPSSRKSLHIFLDEPQNIESWEKAVRGFHDDGLDVTITGSSSRLLSKEIATSLRGRSASFMILPFSFSEFIRARKTELDTKRIGFKDRAVLLGELDAYLRIGGFPELVMESDERKRLHSLMEYLDLIVFRDIVERFDVRNTAMVKWLARAAMASASGELSVHRLHNSLRSEGMSVSKNSLYDYLSMLEESMFLFVIRRFSPSPRKKKVSEGKVYLSDVGFLELTARDDARGRRMENQVFLQILRELPPGDEISYWKDPAGHEVDFVISSGGKPRLLIQSCYTLKDSETSRRELIELEKASQELKCKKAIIVTYDEGGREDLDGLTVEKVPLWEFLLNQSIQ